VGKSTLLANLAKSSDADINIIALIGERGREVRHFVEKTLGEEGMKKSIVFVATSDMSSAIKLRTAQLAMATAEYFRDAGQQVLYLFDATAEQNALLRQAREHIMRFEESRSLIQAGLYVSGSDPKLDAAISVYDALDGFVGESGHAGIGETFAALDKIISGSPENND